MSSREYLAIRTHPRITICPTNEFHPAISLNLKREDLYKTELRSHWDFEGKDKETSEDPETKSAHSHFL